MIPFRIKTHYTLGLGYSKPQQILDRCKKLGYTSAAISDLNSLSGTVEFNDVLNEGEVKPIIGIEIQTVENEGTLLLLAKNLEGWKELMKLSSTANTGEYFKYHPRIDFSLLPRNGNLICITGYNGSYASKTILSDDNSNTIEDVQSKLDIDCMAKSLEVTKELCSVFGAENVFIGVCLDNTPTSVILTDIYRKVGGQLNIPCIALPDIYYVEEKDRVDHYILLCGTLGITINQIKNYRGEHNRFFSNQYHMMSEIDLISLGYTIREILNTDAVGNLCEKYKLSHPPRLPNYEWTDGLTETEYLRKLCREGWVKRYNDTWDKKIYGDRVKHELDVFERNNLEGYFLIVQDYINYAKNEGWLVVCRGSAGGCLISYLLGITHIDPIKYKLTFERFFNDGRKGSLPDIDGDFPIMKRDFVKNYIRNKLGHERVAEMATFAKMQGRGALGEVFRINELNRQLATTITECLPQKEEISDLLESDGETSIIMWTLKYQPERVEQYCKYNDGVFSGEYALAFEQAARIEGTIKSQGKHAAGLVIAPVDLKEICPMIRDPKGNELITGLDMNSAKILGLCKMDILGVAALDKLMAVNSLLKYGRINP